MSREVGGVPEGWQKVKLGELAGRITKGTTPSSIGHNFTDDGINFVKIESLGEDGKFLKDKFARIAEQTHDYLSRSQLEEDDILFSIAGALGKVAVVIPEILPANTNQALGIIKLKDRKVAPFIEAALKGSAIQALVHGIKTVGAQPNINLEQLGNFPILLPPLLEQRKIAAILSTWDDSLATLTGLLAAKRQQKRGLAEALLTGKKRLPGFAGEWEERNIGSLFTSSVAGEWGQEADDTAFSIPVIRATNFSKLGGLDLRPEKIVIRAIPERKFTKVLLEKGDLILEKSGGSPDQPVGRVRFFDSEGQFTFSNFMNRLRPKRESDSKFLFYALDEFYNSKRVLEFQQQTTGIINLQLSDYLGFGVIPVPPLAEQQAIASILSTLDAEIASLEALRAKVQEQKRGLMDVLLTGRVRVKVEE